MNHGHQHDDHESEIFAQFDRRSFLKLSGFTFAGTLLAGCQPAKLDKAIPYLIQPEEITPGVAYWYATTCGGCNAGCGVLAKNRDGRPIKLEGNPSHPISQGGLCAIGQAHLLSLYDSHRLTSPLIDGTSSMWESVDSQIVTALKKIRQSNGPVRVLTKSVVSPTKRATIAAFLATFKNAKHVEYDPISYSAVLDAHRLTHGTRMLPRYRFEKAEVIVSLDADFLGTWISPVEFMKGYRAVRTLEGTPPKFSHHVQVESRLSLTGSNADRRMNVKPSAIKLIVIALAQKVAVSSGSQFSVPGSVQLSAEEKRVVDEIAECLLQHRGQSLVVCGVNDLGSQLAVNALNEMLGNYGSTVDIARPSNQFRGDDAELKSLIDEIRAGKVAALLVDGNPVYDAPGGFSLAEAIKKIPLTVSFSEWLDETSAAVKFVCPQPHELERWDDTEAVEGIFSITQPTVQPLRNARTMMESLTAWMGVSLGADELIKRHWEKTVFTRQTKIAAFNQFWTKTLEDGFVVVETEKKAPKRFNFSALRRIELPPKTAGEKFTLVVHPSITMLDGTHAYNPCLQELPDPVTKIVWDNYVSISPKAAEQLGVERGEVVVVSVGDVKVELPAHVQIGQEDSTLAIALGYGRMGTDRFSNIHPEWLQAVPTVQPGDTVGKNAAAFLDFNGGTVRFIRDGAAISKTGKTHALARTQEYDSLKNPNLLGTATEEKRPIIQQTSLAAFAANPSSGSFDKHETPSMWADDHQYKGHRWGMAIDLTACTGCSACVVGCVAENNIPVVGKDEVRRNRELNWLRIDRYVDEENGELTVSHQPMLCQHCGNAPCETVCPYLATVHDSEGLNQQIYNRCVGTRYCANNCPYKVRHFNWFQYPRGDELQTMVLNPDVTVRDRGVMEKCSFCVQRIQLAKIEAKNAGRELKDGDIKTACQQSCPADAIAFGDMNDPASAISVKMKNPRYYRVLEELGVRPSVGYLTQVRSTVRADEEAHRG